MTKKKEGDYDLLSVDEKMLIHYQTALDVCYEWVDIPWVWNGDNDEEFHVGNQLQLVEDITPSYRELKMLVRMSSYPHVADMIEEAFQNLVKFAGELDVFCVETDIDLTPYANGVVTSADSKRIWDAFNKNRDDSEDSPVDRFFDILIGLKEELDRKCNPAQTQESGKKLTEQEADRKLSAYKKKHKKLLGAREMADMYECSVGLIHKTPTWKKEMKDRNASRSPNPPKAVQNSEPVLNIQTSRDTLPPDPDTVLDILISDKRMTKDEANNIKKNLESVPEDKRAEAFPLILDHWKDTKSGILPKQP